MAIDFMAARSSAPISEIVGRYVELRRSGREHVGLCPFHGDSNPSLTVYTGRDNVGRYWCPVCGERGDAVDFVSTINNISLAEAARLLGADDLPAYTPAPPAPPAPEWQPLLPVPADAEPMRPAKLWNPKRDRYTAIQPSRCDEYRNSAGELLGYVLRDELPGGRKWTPTVTYCRGPGDKYRWSLVPFPAPRPLQGLDELARRPAAPVLIVSGEKCRAVAAAELPGFVAITWPGGDNAVAKTDWGPLAGRNLTFWPDADPSGLSAIALASTLANGEMTRFIDTAGLNPGDDIADLVDQGMTTEQIIAWAKPRIKIAAVGGGEMPSPERGETSEAAPKAATIQNTTISSGEPTKKTLTAEIIDLPRPTVRTESVKILWDRHGLEQSQSGAIASLDNVVRIVETHPEFLGRIWYDEFFQRVFTTWGNTEPREWLDVDDIRLQLWIQRVFCIQKLGIQPVRDAVTVLARAHRRNEVREWLNGLVWDAVPRLANLLATGFGAEHSEYSSAVSRCWLISMAARALDPGCKVDNMPVFEGSQGLKKSTALRLLVGKRLFAEAAESPTSKDFFQCLQGKLLVEIGEMHSFSRSEVETIKRVVSCQSDRYRAPYGRRAEDHPRMGVLAGTTNRDDWNRDETGARRFWPVACGQLDLDWISGNREQLFAEAVAAYRAGEPWWDVPTEAARAHQEARRSSDSWEHIIGDWLVGRSETAVGDVLSGALKIEPDRWDKSVQMRVASCLRVLGWRRDTAWRGGKARKVWISGDTLI